MLSEQFRSTGSHRVLSRIASKCRNFNRHVYPGSRSMFTVWFSEGGNQLSKREWPIVPRVGETITLRNSTGLFEVIRVHWQEHEDANDALVAHVSVRSAGS